MTEREVYKGIEFIRISKLPAEQSARIHASFPKEKIFKILKDDEEMLTDCIQCSDYQEWVKRSLQPGSKGVATMPEIVRNGSLHFTNK